MRKSCQNPEANFHSIIKSINFSSKDGKQLTGLGIKKPEKSVKSAKKADAKMAAKWWFGVIETVIIP